jgi:transcription elongation factor GreB
MSKAFTKEDNDAEDEEGEIESPLPSGKNYITPQGLAKLREELRQILDEQRPELVKVISWAASNGDRSENGDYIYGKRKLREIDRRIRFLSKRIELAEVVNPLEKSGKTVAFGATVVVEDESGKRKTYSIVGVDETDISKGRISWLSPMGKALLQGEKGEVVTIRTPKGEEDLEIVDVRYEELP